MNLKNFKDYKEFKELFVREDGTRKNRILLAFLKSKDIRDYCMQSEVLKDAYEKVNSMGEMFNLCNKLIIASGRGYYYINIMGASYNNKLYSTDGKEGICVDGDISSIRYCNIERGRIFKMKIGKMYKHLALSSVFGELLPESVLLYLCEEITRRWECWVSERLPKNEELSLIVNDDFEAIYDSENYGGKDFHSCMTNRGLHTFYENAVKAKAAGLWNAEGKLLARCVVFTEVMDEESDEVLRLAERQYSAGANEIYQRLLIQKLIEGGYIDGYKKTGAGCGEARAFVTNSGGSLSDRSLYIRCELDLDDALSYQDSFKWYDLDERFAYNHETYSADYSLDTTDGYLEQESNYDVWHDEYTTDELVTVYYHGRSYTCSENRLDDFCWVSSAWDGEYHHVDDCVYSDRYGEYMLADNCVYSDYDDDYCDSIDIVYYNAWSNHSRTWYERTIFDTSVVHAINDGELIEVDGEYYWAEDYHNVYLPTIHLQTSANA